MSIPGQKRLAVTRAVAYGSLPRQKLDIYRPRDAAGLPVIVFFYGGGWKGGSRGRYGFLAAPLARAGAVVVVPDYRLYPEVAYPEFVRDCAQAVSWVQSHLAETGSRRLFLMGHSAGAYNAVMLGLNPDWLRDAGVDPGGLAGVIGLAGPYDFLPITDPDIQPVFPDAGPETQPITHARHDAPPLLLLTGEEDRRVKPRHTRALTDKVVLRGGRARAVFYPRLGHVGIVTAITPLLRWRAPVLRDVMAFVRPQSC